MHNFKYTSLNFIRLCSGRIRLKEKFRSSQTPTEVCFSRNMLVRKMQIKEDKNTADQCRRSWGCSCIPYS